MIGMELNYFLSRHRFASSYFLVGLRINYKKIRVENFFYLYYFQFIENLHTIFLSSFTLSLAQFHFGVSNDER